MNWTPESIFLVSMFAFILAMYIKYGKWNDDDNDYF